tara:strand:- start:26 stop:1408 length:1383 start_codon:yes stop_codon:yes gene_type:complete
MSELYNIASEQYVIGGILDENNDVNEVFDRLTSADIYGVEHKKIFKAMEDGVKAGTAIDVMTLTDVIESATGDDLFGYMMELSKNSVSVKSIDSHVTRIIACSNSRNLEMKLATALTDLRSGHSDEAALMAIQSEIGAVRTDTGAGVTHYKSMEETWAELYSELEDRMNGDTPAGLTTGIDELDAILGKRGIQSKDMIIIGARPAGGKTMFAGKVALHVALALKRPALIFSMEMGKTSLMQRFISQGGRVTPDVFYDGDRLDDEFGRIQHAVIPLNKSQLYIDDRSTLTFSDLASSARKFKAAFPDVAMIMIDYIMLMKVEANGRRQDQAFGDVSLALLALGKELDVAMVVLSQCNKSCEARTDKRPIASDLKEISQLEADATHVVMLYNESAYNEDTAMGKVVELILRKNRFGGLGTAHQEIKAGWMEDIPKDELCRRRDRAEMQGKQKDLNQGWGGNS